MTATGRRRDSEPESCKSLAAIDKIRLPAPVGWRPDNSFSCLLKQNPQAPSRTSRAFARRDPGSIVQHASPVRLVRAERWAPALRADALRPGWCGVQMIGPRALTVCSAPVLARGGGRAPARCLGP